MRAIVCDDDELTRTIVGRLVEEVGGEVVGEASTAVEASALIDRLQPDVVVLDMSLPGLPGTDVIEHVRRHHDPCRIVVFTAFDGPPGPDRAGVTVVHKPDFDGLIRALRDQRPPQPPPATDRRRTRARPLPAPSLRAPTGLDDPGEFYTTLADAHPDDVLVVIPLGDRPPEAVAPEVRVHVRAQDRMLVRHGRLVILAVQAGEDGRRSLLGRLAAGLGHLPDGTTAVRIGAEDALGLFTRLTA